MTCIPQSLTSYNDGLTSTKALETTDLEDLSNGTRDTPTPAVSLRRVAA